MSPFDVAFGLLKNLVAGTLCITFIGLIRAAFWKRNQIIPRWLLGVLFASAAFVGLLFPVTYSPGVIRDFRNSLVALASFYGGFPAGLVAAGFAGGYRFYLGGSGAFGGILGLLSSAVVGHFFYRLPAAGAIRYSFRRLLLLGLSVFAITFMWSWTLPKEQVWNAVRTFFFPELIAYPLVTALFGTLYQLETERQASMERFRAVFSESPLGIVVVSADDNRIIDVNPAFSDMLGYARSELTRLDLTDIVHPEHKEDLAQLIPKNLNVGPQELKMERRFLRKTGDIVWLNVAATRIHDQDGHIHYGIAVVEDITDRKHAEEGLNQYLRRLKILHKTDQAILKAHSTEKTIQESLRYIREMVPCQRASVMLFDFDRQEVRVLMAELSGDSRIREGSVVSVKDFIHLETLEKGEPVVFQDLSELSEPTGILKTLKQEGMLSYIMMPLIVQDKLIGTLNLGAGKPSAFDAERIEIAAEVAISLAVAIQNTRLVEEIMHHQQALKKMSARILEAQEAERKRISIELHDEMGQALTGIGINLAVIERLLPDTINPAIRERIGETRLLADQSSDQIKDLSFHLRPSILDDLGLEPTLRWYISRYAKRMGLQVDFEVCDCDASLAIETKTLLYRVVQEALNNVAKHAQARKVAVRIECSEKTTTLSVEDDGIGFRSEDPDPASAPTSGLGLIGIRERMSLVDGNLQIYSEPGKGTRVVVEVPKRMGMEI